tara:strand:+ start:2947 stop:3381 length:435 start_codon:yes stop_codon:yes gene_type:complete
MANLISTTEANSFKKVLEDHFDTFKRSITIHKEPVRVISQTNNQPFAGYGESSEEENVSYVPQSKSFEGLITYDNKQKEIASEIGTYQTGVVRIKVKENAAQYIKNGKTERIEVDGKSFNTITDDKVQNYLGSIFYIFYLQATT